MNTLSEISRVLLVIMYALLSKAVSGYHYIRGKYLEYKYTTDGIHPTDRYYLTSVDHTEPVRNEEVVPNDHVYVEEWIDTKGHKKNVVLYAGAHVPKQWETSPFDLPSVKCPWVWVGDKETEVDLTRTFDKFLLPGNIIKQELVSKLFKSTDHTNLIYIETKTFKQIKFPGDGVTIEVDVD